MHAFAGVPRRGRASLLTKCTLAFSLVLAPVALAQLADAPWPMQGHDGYHTGRSSYLGPRGPSVVVKWKFTAENSSLGSPVIGNGVAFVSSTRNTLYALDTTSGTLKWSFKSHDDRISMVSSPAIGADGHVYAGFGAANVVALDASRGTVKWAFGRGASMCSGVALADRTVFVASSSRSLYALHSSNGTLKWNFTMLGNVYSTPAVALGPVVFVGSSDGAVHAIDGQTGRLWWNRTTRSPVRTSPAIFAPRGYPTLVYVADGEYVSAYDLRKGDVRWKYLTGDSVVSPAVGSDNTVYVCSADGHIYALDAYRGGLKWSFAAESRASAAPTIGSDGTVYVVSVDCRLFALDGGTGVSKFNFRFPTDEQQCSAAFSAIGSDGSLYVTLGDGNLYAVGNNWLSLVKLAMAATAGTLGVIVLLVCIVILYRHRGALSAAVAKARRSTYNNLT